MIHSFLSAAWLSRFAVLALLFPLSALALPEVPAVMLVSGRISAGVGVNTTTPRADDQVLAFSAVDGHLVGSGPVSAAGDYMSILARTASFNGTPVVLELQQGRRRFQLLRDGAPVWLRFQGRTLPERSPPLILQVGVMTAELLADSSAQAQRLSKRPDIPCTPEMDVNGDGHCDDLDWSVLKLFGGGVTRSVGHP
ncbi:MAG: hypothetical protein Q8O38_01895 [Sulfurimicrobium sp.]|nr:hypothetical protein [Sulfurimicrobium sp.]